MTTITETHLSAATLSRRGKVRELYDLGDSLLLVASDRISAFDVILTPGIPDKGKVLTQLSNFWFRRFSDVHNHLIETDITRVPEDLRGYLAVAGWAEYKKSGTVCGIRLPQGLREADKLPESFFTPATTTETGHDE